MGRMNFEAAPWRRAALRRAAPGLLTFSLAAPVAYGESVYVVEQLVAAVSSTPGSEGERVGQVKSGDKLELLERQADEAHVKLSNGKDGWIKSSYLSTEEPLQLRLNARIAELDRLKPENDKLKQDVSRLQSELTSARATHAATPPPPTAATPPPATPAASAPDTPIRETVFLRSPDRPGQIPWTYLLGVSTVMLLVGFLVGWKTLDRRIRQKYGGLRIY
jgi:hypothetical protein